MEGQDTDGFWLNLGGVREFVPIEPLGLTSGNKMELRKYLAERHIEFEHRYQALLAEKQDLQEMSKKLEEFGYNQNYADIFVKRLLIESFKFDEMLPQTQKELESAITLYEQKVDLLVVYNNYKSEYETNIQEIRDRDSESGGISERIESLRRGIDGKNSHQLSQLVMQSEVSLGEVRESLQICVRPSSSDLEEFLDVIVNIKHDDIGGLRVNLARDDGILEERMRVLQDKLPDAEKLFTEARAKYITEFGMLSTPTTLVDSNNIIDLRNAFESSDRNFKTKMDSFILEHVPQSRHLLEGTPEINYIARTALPRVFNGKEENISVTEQIAKRLALLNEKNRELDGSSADTILRYFRDVWYSHGRNIAIISRLKQFFSGENALITGGYRVKLTMSDSKEYPLSWISELRDNLTLADMPLFSDQISDSTLQDVVIETFKRHAGGTKMPDIKRLLDPKSYLDVSFALENERGQTYGSEGQAYTAVALLCIARLSIVEDSHGKSRRGVRFMPIDEAEGIGSNYQTLHSLAVKYGYQVVSMSINSVVGVKAGEQNVYTLIANPDRSSGVNSDPFPMLGYYHEYASLFFPEDEK